MLIMGGYARVAVGGIQEISVPLSQFRCKPQMLNYINRGIVK